MSISNNLDPRSTKYFDKNPQKNSTNNLDSNTAAGAEFDPDEHSDLVDESEVASETSQVSEQVEPDMDTLGHTLADIMNHSPFVAYTGIRFSYENGEIYGKFLLEPHLIGNPKFEILHGGMTATILDTIGGLVGMFEIYKRHQGTFEEQTKKVQRLATVDLRIDYLAPGRGKEFTATAEVIRLGRKGCTTRMVLVNDEGKKIAHGIGSYAF